MLPYELGDAVDAHVVGQDVVIRIAGMDDGFVHVHDTVAALVVAEGMVAEGEVARIIDRLLRRALAHFQRGQRHERLEGRAGGRHR